MKSRTLSINIVQPEIIILSKQRTKKGAGQTVRMRRLICAFVVRTCN